MVAAKRGLQGLAAAGMLMFAACAPIPQNVDTPINGANIDLSVDQPMHVRWGNLWPEQGSWVLETEPATAALKLQGRNVQPPANGAQQLETFDFIGAAKGQQALTFVFKRKDGTPPNADERVTITVNVT